MAPMAGVEITPYTYTCYEHKKIRERKLPLIMSYPTNSAITLVKYDGILIALLECVIMVSR